MIGQKLLVELFQAAEMRRWNDKLCPVPLTELDKQGHKMTIAYVLGKFIEERASFQWTEIIEGGLFEYFERLMLTDIKPQIFERIKANEGMFYELKTEVFERFGPLLACVDGLDERFYTYLFASRPTLNRRILDAAHFYATKWEFDIIKRENRQDYEIEEIRRDLQRRQEALADVEGLRHLSLFPTYRNFVDLCGRLRFQVRWGQLYRVPRTSVLGHMFIVAALSYFLALELNACPKRRANAYFAGLFHDLPEALTKDIISPVKRAATDMDRFINKLEHEEMERRIYRPKLIPKAWQPEMRLFTEDEFASKVTIDGRLKHATSEEINTSYNKDSYNPVDGELVRAADDLAAFMEAHLALQHGISNQQLLDAMRMKRSHAQHAVVGGLRLAPLYEQFGAP